MFIMHFLKHDAKMKYCGWLDFRGYQFSWIEKNDAFMGFKICGHSIFFHNSYRKLTFRGYWNLWIRPSMKFMKIGTPQNVSHPQYFYTPVFRRDVLWYGDVRPSGSPSVRPSIRHSFPHFSPTCFEILS